MGANDDLGIVGQTCAYMLNVGLFSQAELATSFRRASMAGALQDKLELTIAGQAKEVKGFRALTKAFKTQLYKVAALGPRPSDPDFIFREGQEPAPLQDARVIMIERLRAKLEDLPVLVNMLSFLKARIS